VNSVRFTSSYQDILEVVKDSLGQWKEQLLCKQAGQTPVDTAHSTLYYHCLLTGSCCILGCGGCANTTYYSFVAVNRCVCLLTLAPSVNLSQNCHVIILFVGCVNNTMLLIKLRANKQTRSSLNFCTVLALTDAIFQHHM
jgi:hypothetical protein